VKPQYIVACPSWYSLEATVLQWSESYGAYVPFANSDSVSDATKIADALNEEGDK
jgi:hypothetical protein